MIAYAIIAAVAAQRVGELWYARRNTRALLSRGAVEAGRSHYPLFVVLHAAWLTAILLALPSPWPIHLAALAGYIILETFRVWTMFSLGSYWTTRILTVPGEPLVRRGPYRFLKHPNYVIVSGEIALLPLVFGEVWIALVFTVLNALLLIWRIRAEEDALVPRRALPIVRG